MRWSRSAIAPRSSRTAGCSPSGGLDELLGSGGVRIRLTGLSEAGRAALARRGGLSEHEGWFIVSGVDVRGGARADRRPGCERRQGVRGGTGASDTRGAVPGPDRGGACAMAALTIARLTIREAARRKLLLALAILTVIVIGLTGWGFQHLTTLTNPDGTRIAASRAPPCDVAGADPRRVHVQWRARPQRGRGRVAGDLERARVRRRALDARAPGQQVRGGARKMARPCRAHRRLRCRHDDPRAGCGGAHHGLRPTGAGRSGRVPQWRGDRGDVARAADQHPALRDDRRRDQPRPVLPRLDRWDRRRDR